MFFLSICPEGYHSQDYLFEPVVYVTSSTHILLVEFHIFFILPVKAFKAKGNMHYAMFLVIHSPVRDRKKNTL